MYVKPEVMDSFAILAPYRLRFILLGACSCVQYSLGVHGVRAGCRCIQYTCISVCVCTVEVQLYIPVVLAEGQ